MGASPATEPALGKKGDPVLLVAGGVIAAFGVILLLDATGALTLRFAALAPLAAFMVGAILLASGLARRG
jgi:hypothetical protein